MITAYHRPHTIQEALDLLSQPNIYPLGGGTILNRPSPDCYTVVDLQALGLHTVNKVGENLVSGATVTLQILLESVHTPEALKKAIRLEAPINLRNMGTVAGALVACDGHSSFAAVLLALDARVTIAHLSAAGDSPTMTNILFPIGEILPIRSEILAGKLITQIEIPLNIRLSYEYVARSPADRPIVHAALAQWPSGRTRLVIGGWGSAPSLAMDGNDASGIEEAARNAAHEASDEWASAEYRAEVAAVLAKRCLDKV
jgi:CO/xanthine dehydrogenase FAD-binding subunit